MREAVIYAYCRQLLRRGPRRQIGVCSAQPIPREQLRALPKLTQQALPPAFVLPDVCNVFISLSASDESYPALFAARISESAETIGQQKKLRQLSGVGRGRGGERVTL